MTKSKTHRLFQPPWTLGEKIRRLDVWLIICIIIAVVARVWGINFGLPHNEVVPDESFVVNIAIRFGSGDLHPHNFLYPTLFMYAAFALIGAYFAIGKLLGIFPSVSAFEAQFLHDPSNIYLIARLLSAAAGVLTILIVYRIALLILDKRMARISALFLAVAFLHVRDSHFGKVDVMMTLFIMLSVLFVLMALQSHKHKHYLLAGVFAGLAISTKYMAAALVVAMLAVHIMNVLDEHAAKSKFIFDSRLVLFIGSTIALFFVGTPFALVDLKAAFSDFLLNIGHAGAHGHSAYVDVGWWYHLRFSLWLGLGVPLFIAGFAGIVLVVAQKRRQAIALLAFPIAYYVVMGSGQAVFTRYMVPVIPFLCLTAAYAVVVSANWLSAQTKQTLRPGVTAVGLMFIAALPTAWHVAQFDTLATTRDNRLVATDWVQANIPAGSSILQIGDRSSDLQLKNTPEYLQAQLNTLLAQGKNDPQIKVLRIKLNNAKTTHTPGYEQWLYDVAKQRPAQPDGMTGKLPEYMIVMKSALTNFNKTPSAINTLLQSDYQLVQSFVAMNPDNPNNQWDRQDAYYLPYANYDEVQRPGPNVFVYHRIHSATQ